MWADRSLRSAPAGDICRRRVGRSRMTRPSHDADGAGLSAPHSRLDGSTQGEAPDAHFSVDPDVYFPCSVDRL